MPCLSQEVYEIWPPQVITPIDFHQGPKNKQKNVLLMLLGINWCICCQVRLQNSKKLRKLSHPTETWISWKLEIIIRIKKSKTENLCSKNERIDRNITKNNVDKEQKKSKCQQILKPKSAYFLHRLMGVWGWHLKVEKVQFLAFFNF